MKRPVKPRTPSKVVKPSEFEHKGRKVGSINSWKGITLAQAIEKIVERTSRKLGIPIEEVDHSQIMLRQLMADIYGPSDKPNRKYNTQMKAYKESANTFPERKRKFQKKLKQYEIEMRIYEAWCLKVKEDKLLTEKKNLETQISKIVAQKLALLAAVGHEEA